MSETSEDSTAGGVFSVGNVQISLPSGLVHLCCENNIFVAVCETAIVRVDLGSPSEIESVPLRFGSQQPVRSAFLDPTGQHLLVSSLTENVYMYAGRLDMSISKQQHDTIRAVRPLNKLRGTAIESVAWQQRNRSAATYRTDKSVLSRISPSSTADCIVGTSHGTLVFVSLAGPAQVGETSFGIPLRSGNVPDKYVRQLHKVPGNEPITGLYYEKWDKKVVLFASTATRLLQYVSQDKGQDFAQTLVQLFSSNGVPRVLDLGGDRPKTKLCFHYDSVAYDPSVRVGPTQAMAWLTSISIYCGFVQYAQAVEMGDSVVESARLVPFPGDIEQDLVSIELTRWHLVCVYKSSIVVTNILTDRVVFAQSVTGDAEEELIGATSDSSQGTFWVYSSSSIYELVVGDEGRDISDIYMKRGLWHRAVDTAESSEQANAVYSQWAEAELQGPEPDYELTARLYSQSSRAFEHVALQFYDRGQRPAFATYVALTLEKMPRHATSQRTMLATLLLELLLVFAAEEGQRGAHNEAQMGRGRDADRRETQAGRKRDAGGQETQTGPQKGREGVPLCLAKIAGCLERYADVLDLELTCKMLYDQGWRELMVQFMLKRHEFRRVVYHFVRNGNYEKALKIMAAHDDLSIYYEQAETLLVHVPEKTVDAFCKEERLDVELLLPALIAAGFSERASMPHITRYLDRAVSSQALGPNVHNTLVSLFANYELEHELLRYLSKNSTGTTYDAAYALRMCEKHNLKRACAKIYSVIGNDEAAVAQALECGDLGLAKENASSPRDAGKKKKLWVSIVEHVVRTSEDKTQALGLLKDTDVLQLGDILAHFDDFETIDAIKGDVVTALEAYVDKFDALQGEMQGLTENLVSIQSSIDKARKRFFFVEPSDICMSCGMVLMTRAFYMFPCLHGHHADCLLGLVLKRLSSLQLRRLLDLQTQIMQVRPADPLRYKLDPKGAVSSVILPRASRNDASEVLRPYWKLVRADVLLGGGGVVPEHGVNSLLDSVHFDTGRALFESVHDLLSEQCVLCADVVSQVDEPLVGDAEI